MIKGWKKLTKEELQHLRENGCNNTVLFQRTINEQARIHKECGFDDNPYMEVCYDCKNIAKKLGMVANDL